MTPCKFSALDGSEQTFDLDDVVDVVEGKSGRRDDWSALVVYRPGAKMLIELRDSPPDYRGGQADEAEEVTDEYVCKTFCLAADDLELLRRSPRRWKLIDSRPSTS
jgi:hypothetical protein